MTNMLSEHAVVYSKERLDEKVDKGCEGTIVFVYDTNVFEVEFFDNKNCTIGLYTVSQDKIEGTIHRFLIVSQKNAVE